MRITRWSMACVAAAAALMLNAHVAQADPINRCRDPLARTLADGGFTGHTNRVAWAVVMRESRGQVLKPGHSHFNGHDWGIWQINKPTWGGQRWWSDAAMTDPKQQTRIAFKYLTKRGTYWAAWGLAVKGGRVWMDTRNYGMWSSWQHQNWIWAPFMRYYNAYPKGCR